MEKAFLKAEWRKLVMANYEIDSNLLKPHLPFKTEIDTWNNTCYVSLVGFMFLNTHIKGFKIPFHTNFEEINLRFYVRYKQNNHWKRGVVFIKEIVPKCAITLVANTLYNEKYETLPTKHSWLYHQNQQTIEYQWKKKNNWNSIKATTTITPLPIHENTEAQFITEHYWGYTKIQNNKTSEYNVLHPTWQIYQTIDFEINVDFYTNYGQTFSSLTTQTPKSVFVAEGSIIQVNKGNII